MTHGRLALVAAGLLVAVAVAAAAQPPPRATTVPDPVATLVSRLDLASYKATIKALTQFGDRREGTDRNRAAVDWIDAQLRRYGCATERLVYELRAAEPAAVPQPPPSLAAPTPPAGALMPPSTLSVGGGRPRGVRVSTTPNTDPANQPDARLRALNTQGPEPGRRDEVYCTKVGASRPDEMYIVGAHMDGRGFGEAANDNGSGTALVMELARIFSAPDVRTERSIRFILWNNEETGLAGSASYVAQRRDRQGVEDPPGSGRYPEPRWLGMIQHDMMLFDHGAPRADGTVSREQRAEADVNIEFQADSQRQAESAALAWVLQRANDKYATDYPAVVGRHMTNTDSSSFMDLVPSVSVRENERGPQIGNGWDPQWHQPTDLFATYNDADFRLGLNAAQTTLAAVAELATASVR